MRLSIGSGSAGAVLPGRAGPAAFEEREAVGVEQAAAVGGQAQLLVLDAAVDGAEGGEQPRPGVVPALQHLLAVLVGLLVELGARGSRRRSAAS